MAVACGDPVKRAACDVVWAWYLGTLARRRAAWLRKQAAIRANYSAKVIQRAWRACKHAKIDAGAAAEKRMDTGTTVAADAASETTAAVAAAEMAAEIEGRVSTAATTTTEIEGEVPAAAAAAATTATAATASAAAATVLVAAAAMAASTAAAAGTLGAALMATDPSPPGHAPARRPVATVGTTGLAAAHKSVAAGKVIPQACTTDPRANEQRAAAPLAGFGPPSVARSESASPRQPPPPLRPQLQRPRLQVLRTQLLQPLPAAAPRESLQCSQTGARDTAGSAAHPPQPPPAALYMLSKETTPTCPRTPALAPTPLRLSANLTEVVSPKAPAMALAPPRVSAKTASVSSSPRAPAAAPAPLHRRRAIISTPGSLPTAALSDAAGAKAWQGTAPPGAATASPSAKAAHTAPADAASPRPALAGSLAPLQGLGRGVLKAAVSKLDGGAAASAMAATPAKKKDGLFPPVPDAKALDEAPHSAGEDAGKFNVIHAVVMRGASRSQVTLRLRH
uniref:Uncharacterized protein n=1 Tax=Chlamydomonas euryale TaxID=1486919 RepID=A0A7R9VXX8_9CHLO